MSRIAGIGVGVVIALLALMGFRNAAEGWGASHTDIGLWYTIIASFLLIASAVVVVGTVLHTRGRPR